MRVLENGVWVRRSQRVAEKQCIEYDSIQFDRVPECSLSTATITRSRNKKKSFCNTPIQKKSSGCLRDKAEASVNQHKKEKNDNNTSLCNPGNSNFATGASSLNQAASATCKVVKDALSPDASSSLYPSLSASVRALSSKLGNIVNSNSFTLSSSVMNTEGNSSYRPQASTSSFSRCSSEPPATRCGSFSSQGSLPKQRSGSVAAGRGGEPAAPPAARPPTKYQVQMSSGEQSLSLECDKPVLQAPPKSQPRPKYRSKSCHRQDDSEDSDQDNHPTLLPDGMATCRTLGGSLRRTKTVREYILEYFKVDIDDPKQRNILAAVVAVLVLLFIYWTDPCNFWAVSSGGFFRRAKTHPSLCTEPIQYVRYLMERIGIVKGRRGFF